METQQTEETNETLEANTAQQITKLLGSLPKV